MPDYDANELFTVPYGRFKVGDRVGLIEGTCFGKVAGFSCCGVINVDLMCTHPDCGDSLPRRITCSADDLEHID